MLRLDESLRAWGTPAFAAVLNQELAHHAGLLPLQQGLSASSSVAETPITVMILNTSDAENTLSIKAGIFYQGLVGGCSCADDPGPVNENTEYCVVSLEIDKASALATVALMPD
jgi:hypothetical protein